MNAVYIRIVVYALSTLATMIPLGWTDFLSYNEMAGTVTISIEGLAAAAVTGVIASLGVFKAFGTKP